MLFEKHYEIMKSTECSPFWPFVFIQCSIESNDIYCVIHLLEGIMYQLVLWKAYSTAFHWERLIKPQLKHEDIISIFWFDLIWFDFTKAKSFSNKHTQKLIFFSSSTKNHTLVQQDVRKTCNIINGINRLSYFAGAFFFLLFSMELFSSCRRIDKVERNTENPVEKKVNKLRYCSVSALILLTMNQYTCIKNIWNSNSNHKNKHEKK